MSDNGVNYGNVVPSYSKEAERAVIAAMLNRDKAIIEATGILSENCFYNGVYGNLFKIISELFNEGIEIDIVAVTERLNRQGETSPGVISELCDLSSFPPVTSSVVHHSRIVYEKYLKRQTAYESSKLYYEAIDQRSDPFKIIEAARTRFDNLSRSLLNSSLFTPERTENVFREYLDDIASGKVKAIRTGFSSLDKIIGGLIAPDLVIIGARTQIGKTSLAMSIINNIGIEDTKRVGIFSLEMSPHQLAGFKLMAYYTNGEVKDLRFGYKINDPSLEAKRKEFWEVFKERHIYIDDSSRLTDLQFYNKAKQMKLKYDVDVIFVDYIQLMNSDARQREEQLANCSKMLKETAKELSIPVVALAQLNREADKFDDTEPKLNQIRYSGAIEQDADIIILIERPGAYNRNTFAGQKAEKAVIDNNNEIAKLHVKKNRLGPCRSCKVKFQKNIGMYRHLDVNEYIDFSYTEPEEAPF